MCACLSPPPPPTHTSLSPSLSLSLSPPLSLSRPLICPLVQVQSFLIIVSLVVARGLIPLFPPRGHARRPPICFRVRCISVSLPDRRHPGRVLLRFLLVHWTKGLLFLFTRSCSKAVCTSGSFAFCLEGLQSVMCPPPPLCVSLSVCLCLSVCLSRPDAIA